MSRCGECPEWIRKNCEENLSLEDCIDTLQMAVWDSAPTIEPKCGEWIWVDDLDGGHWYCSACKTPTEALAAFKIYPFCPFCGARMKGVDDERGQK